MTLEIIANEQCHVEGYRCTIAVPNDQQYISNLGKQLSKLGLSYNISYPDDRSRNRADKKTYIQTNPYFLNIFGQFALAKILHEHGFVTRTSLIEMARNVLSSCTHTMKEYATEEFKDNHQGIIDSCDNILGNTEVFKDYDNVRLALKQKDFFKNLSDSDSCNTEFTNGQKHLRDAVNLLLEIYPGQQKTQWQFLMHECGKPHKRKILEEALEKSQLTEGLGHALLIRIGELPWGVTENIINFTNREFGEINTYSYVQSYKKRQIEKNKEQEILQK